jgi:CubicO group peptidase (beta-lactamase class C family)
MIRNIKKSNPIAMLLVVVFIMVSAAGFHCPQTLDGSPSASRPILKSISISQKGFERYSDNKLKITFQYEDAGADLRGGSLELSVVDDKKEKKSISIPLDKSRYGKVSGKGRVKTVLEIFDSSHLTIKARLVDAAGSKGGWRKITLDSKDLVDETILSNIEEFENNVGPAGAESGNTIYDRMAHYNVPGVSVAVINNGRLQWSRAYGKTISGGNEDVTISTLFQAASLSKTVAAASSMLLVNNGDIDLDENVNNYLTSWKVPDNASTANQKVTLERLLSHTAGIPTFGLPGYGQTDEIPTLLQMLDGQAPATNPAVIVYFVPGSSYNYANLGYIVVQQIFPDVAGIEYGKFTEDNLLKPLKMIRSNFNHLIQASSKVEVARGHSSSGATMAGGWRRYPEHCAAGLWTTSSEYALFLVEILNAYTGKGGKVFSAGDLDEMLRARLENYGLGIGFARMADLDYFTHTGSTPGYRSVFALFPAIKMGAVIMTNGDSGSSLANEIAESLGAVYLRP